MVDGMDGDRIVVMMGSVSSDVVAAIATATTTSVADVGIAMVIGGIGEIVIGEIVIGTTIEGGVAGDRHLTPSTRIRIMTYPARR